MYTQTITATVRNRLLLLGVGLTSLSGLIGCTVAPAGHGTAADKFYKLNSNGKRVVAADFYDLGRSDAVKNLYWAQRRSQEPGFADERPPLERKYISVYVPPYQQPDGTVVEGSNRVIEIVQ
jgi:hypothetical protein